MTVTLLVLFSVSPIESPKSMQIHQSHGSLERLPWLCSESHSGRMLIHLNSNAMLSIISRRAA